MPNVAISDFHSAYLERMSRLLSKRLNRNVSRREVLEAVLNLAVKDEELYDPDDPGTPLTPLRREIVQTERESRISQFSSDELLGVILLRP